MLACVYKSGQNHDHALAMCHGYHKSLIIIIIPYYHVERLDLRLTIPLTSIEIFKICFFPNLVSPSKSSASHRRNPEGDIPLSTGNQEKHYK